jgi:hypothetical protein
MSMITAAFQGNEDATTRQARIKAIYDHYYGAGEYVAAG